MSVCAVASNRMVHGIREGSTLNNRSIAEYVAKNAALAITVDHPFIADPEHAHVMRLYQKGRPRFLRTFAMLGFITRRDPRPRIAYPILKLTDMLTTIVFVLQSGVKLDVFVGTELVNGIAGIFLKKLGKVRRVIYYVMEAYPDRYSSRLANTLFLRLDLFCVEHSDAVWNESDSISRRRDSLWNRTFDQTQLTVPSLSSPPEEENFTLRKGHSLLYLGSLGKDWGVDVAIQAMHLALERVPDLEFHIIGTGTQTDDLVSMCRKLGVSERVHFHGFLPDAEVLKIMRSCRCGVAPYSPVVSLDGKKYFDSSKTKYYARCGLPVVLSSAVPILGKLVKDYRAGLVVEPNPSAFAEAIITLMNDERLYGQCVEGCRALTESFNYENVLARIFSESLGARPAPSP